ncbi:acetoacetate--CoA ligase [Azospirillum brasilense]|uniref:Acetoacetate--CoA ligase n=1 Tax=Azospirillum argentinense TaxID=2970906 RepID=A0A5B0KUK8_9PROT|nr:acetoacetate--CoA ligase [Azospirillum argentinense]KAA1055208.1 Acetoacetyl-CoA synthetase [Azospirillum argentinense]MBK3799381.1 acetoacetate--CoA ligase [Azospirillum argentinense]
MDQPSPGQSLSDQPLWTPSEARVAASNLTAFRQAASARFGLRLDDYDALYDWSVAGKEDFWRFLWEWAGLKGDLGGVALADGDKMPGARWFPEASLNYAENMLANAPEGEAVVFWAEDKVKRRWSGTELKAEVSRLQQALKAAGVGKGDRVAAVVPNMPETLAAMLATASLGAIWSSCSPDFGAQGITDRFGQIEPTVLFAPDAYWYNGKSHDIRAKIAQVLTELPTVKAAVIIPYVNETPDVSAIRGGVTWGDFIAPFAAAEPSFERVAFNHPLFILYSSGTTGKPKCIVHGTGGTLLQHVKEHRLHSDVKPGDRVFYYTTCGWMMWNWLVSGLAAGATLLLYDGSPFAPDGNILFDYADAEGMTLFGTSAKFIQQAEKSGLEPIRTHRLDTLRALASTGSPLMPENFAYVYRAIKTDIHLASISGGTDIVSCFVLGNPTAPVWAGELQTAGLGMAVAAFDDAGHAVSGEKGELVCTRPFPCMPVGFWADPDGAKYRAAYFERFPNVWTHGDFIERTVHGGWVIYGRSDAVLNPGGVRIGTAEIYRQVEQLPEILEAVCIGQEWDGDVRVILFVVLREGLTLDKALEDTIRKRIKENCSPRHVPARIVAVKDIPRTRSGKITELAVRDAVHGRPIKNTEALANPMALDEFRERPELEG